MAISTIARVETPLRVPSRTALPAGSLTIGLGFVGFLASFVGNWNPSFWGDEAASVMSAERPLPSLFRMLGNVDAVHGTYYLFLHFWIRAFGTSELSVRLPSAIAIGFVVAGVFVLGSRLSSRRLGVVSAIVCAVIPRIGSIGGDARSYAISTAIAVWLTVLLVELARRGSTRKLVWAGYAAGLAVGLYFFLFLLLLIPVHGLYLLLRRQMPGVRRRWLQAVVAGMLLATPVLFYGYQERSQIAFLRHRNYATFSYVTVTQWFGKPSFAVVAWALILVALVAGVFAVRRRHSVPPVALLAAVWLVVPTALLLALNTVTPSYNLRYLSLSAPAAALVIAAGILALRRRWLIVVALAAVVAMAIPVDVAQRGPYANDQGSDWRQASQYVAAHSRPGDAVVFDDTVRNSRLPRLAMRMYPQDYRGLDDVELVTPFADTSGLWDVTAPLDNVTGRLATTDRVVLLEERGSRDRASGSDLDTLEGVGFELHHAKIVNRTVVYILTRGTP